jgi:hypothetical protein
VNSARPLPSGAVTDGKEIQMEIQLSRKAAGLSLILAPVLGLVAVCAWPPLRSGDRAQIAAIAAQPGRWYVFALFILLSSYLLVPAVLALIGLLRPHRPRWAAVAGSVALLGVLVSIGDSATELIYSKMGASGASLSQMAALATRYDSSPVTSLIYLTGGAAVLSGMALLSAGLWRSQAVPAWTAAGILVGTVLNLVGLSSASVPLAIASYTVRLAALSRIAAAIVATKPEAAGPLPEPARATGSSVYADNRS